MSTARDNVLSRVRKALGKRERDIAGLAAAEAIIAAHAQGPRPRLAENRVERFMQRARDMESTVERIVDGMEDAFALIRRERGALPRAVNLISGPSRTGDIEQTIVLGAHGPFRVHILIV